MQNKNGATAAIYAVNFSQGDILELLLKKGADLSIKDNNGHGATDHAQMQGNTVMMEMLLFG